ncbi:MAG: hypothetical protein K9L30_14120 [Desulfobacterales bacterium]|nr:hypothetical protein [Desulfobacterales bacterium]
MKIYSISKIITAAILIFTFCGTAHADSYSKAIDAYKRSEVVQPFFESAYGFAVFPAIGKGGVGIGGGYGKGQVYQGGNVTGKASVFEVSIGFQLGGQAFSEIIFFVDKRAYDEFTGGSFEFDVTASAVAINAGVQAKAGTEGSTSSANKGVLTGKQAKTEYQNGMAVFIYTKGGLMYEASISGQKFNFEANE